MSLFGGSRGRRVTSSIHGASLPTLGIPFNREPTLGFSHPLGGPAPKLHCKSDYYRYTN